MLFPPASSPKPPTSALLLDSFRRDRARGTNDDIDLTLRPAYRDLLARLGNPHTKLPPVFHVAGTNGKGSTCAFLRAMLEAAGKRVHVYTSPHLVRFHERIRVAGALISEAELAAILTECRQHAEENRVTFFEAATAAAFTAFARHPADYTLVEVGLGGRLDATNVIPKPIASIITRLSYDHRDYLGDTIHAIAREKAGIMREGVPCFAAAQPDMGALQTLRDEARKMGAPLYVAGEDWQVAITAHGFRYSDVTHSLDLPPPALLGEHQYHNAGLAIAALLGVLDQERSNSLPLTGREHGSSELHHGYDFIIAGLHNVTWPARLQKITGGALYDVLPENSELWLDGGHNDSAGEALAGQAAQWQTEDDRSLHLICGMLTTKRPDEFLRSLQTYARSFTAVPVPDEPAGFMPEDLARLARQTQIADVHVAGDVMTAIKNIVTGSNKPVRLLVCGSLYLAGDVLRVNEALSSLP